MPVHIQPLAMIIVITCVVLIINWARQNLAFEIMQSDNNLSLKSNDKLEKLLESDVYKENVQFWDRAWGGVKTAYTQMPELLYLPWIPEKLKEKKAETVLDLGCGSGWLSIFLARHDYKVTGIDVSQHAIELGLEWAKKEKLNIEFLACDIAQVPFTESSFQAIVANSIFEHFPLAATKEIFKIMKTILVPGGVFIACFDEVGMGAGEYFKLEDETHVYTDKARKGMLLRNYSDDELESLLQDWDIETITPVKNGSRFVVATNK